MEVAGVNPKYLGEMKNLDIAKAIRQRFFSTAPAQQRSTLLPPFFAIYSLISPASLQIYLFAFALGVIQLACVSVLSSFFIATFKQILFTWCQRLSWLVSCILNIYFNLLLFMHNYAKGTSTKNDDVRLVHSTSNKNRYCNTQILISIVAYVYEYIPMHILPKWCWLCYVS